MTKREGAVISAYTGCLCCNFEELHKYVEELMNRPVFTHELPILSDKIKEKSKEEFMKIIDSQIS